MTPNPKELENMLVSLYTKIDLETPKEQRDTEFVEILLKHLKVCISNPTEENMSQLQELLGQYSRTMLDSAYANDSAAITFAQLADNADAKLKTLVEGEDKSETQPTQQANIQSTSNAAALAEEERIRQIQAQIQQLAAQTKVQ